MGLPLGLPKSYTIEPTKSHPLRVDVLDLRTLHLVAIDCKYGEHIFRSLPASAHVLL
jgi:hypothetical protein